jgi:hypothetical protein
MFIGPVIVDTSVIAFVDEDHDVTVPIKHEWPSVFVSDELVTPWQPPARLAVMSRPHAAALSGILAVAGSTTAFVALLGVLLWARLTAASY